MKLPIIVLPHGLGIPSYATEGSAGFDLQAAVSENLCLKPSERLLVPTGLSMAIPQGFEGQIRPRSGLAYKNGITVLNSPGTIDSDYRGEVKVLLVNHSQQDFIIESGMRIAQMLITPVVQVNFEAVNNLENIGTRLEGGFGSTGTH